MICTRCGSPMDEGTPRCPSCSAGPGGRPADDPTVLGHRRKSWPGELPGGECIAGRYEIRDGIGRGPNGLVYRALDRQVEIEVALKIVSAERLPDGDARGRFVQALGLAGKLTHPNIVRCFELGIDGDRCYLATQLCEGLTLRKLLEMRAPMHKDFELSEADNIAGQVARGLSAAHKVGLLAGVLRPENIVILPSAVKVADIGLWMALPRAAAQAALEQTHAARYRAPELDGEGIAHTGSDVYSLAVILEEMLGSVAKSGPLGEILAQARAQSPQERPLIDDLAGELTAIARTGVRRPQRPPRLTPVPFAVPGGETRTSLREPSWKTTQQPGDKEVMDSGDTVRMSSDDLEQMLDPAKEPTREVDEEELLLLRERSSGQTEQVDLDDVLVREDEDPTQQEEILPLRAVESPAARREDETPVVWQPAEGIGSEPVPAKPVAMLQADEAQQEVPGPTDEEEAPTPVPLSPKANGRGHPAVDEPKVIYDSVSTPVPGGIVASGAGAAASAPRASETLTMRVPRFAGAEFGARVLGRRPAGAPAFVAGLLIVVFVSVTVATLVYLSSRSRNHGKSGRTAAGPTPAAAPLVGGSAAGPPAAKTPIISAPPAVVMGEDGCPLGSKLNQVGRHAFCIDSYEFPGGKILPRTKVTWSDADHACQARGARLCTRAEWVASCRGPHGARYPYGAAHDPSRCNISGTVQPAGSFGMCKSPAGAYDMIGNVAEWVAEKVVLGATGGTGRVQCGSEQKVDVSATRPDVGFRCCADGPASKAERKGRK